MAIGLELDCYDRLSTLNAVVSYLTDSQVLLRFSVFGHHGLVVDPDASNAHSSFGRLNR